MDEQQLKEAFMQYLLQKSGAQTQQEFEAYIQQLGEEGLQEEYTQFMQMIQSQQVAAKRFGGMLNYIGKLRGVCPEGYEMQFFKQGGKTGSRICKKCVQKAKMMGGGPAPKNVIDAFRQKRQIDKNNSIRNVIEGSVRSGRNSFNPNETQLPSRNADGMMATPNRILKSGEGPNNILTPRKPIKKSKCGSKVETDKCGKKMKKKACGGLVKKNEIGGPY